LRNATTESSEARDTETAKSGQLGRPKDGHDTATDNTKSKIGRRPASRADKSENSRRDVRTKPTEAEQRPVEAEQAPETNQAPETARCGNPFTSAWELALLPTRLTMAATAKAMKMLTSSDDGPQESVVHKEPRLDGREESG
jgi:hypothetical protein